jgi:hypothetical protein
MSPALVAQMVALVFLSQGRDVPDGVADVWLHIFDDLTDGPDVLEVTSRVLRAQEYVTAGDIHRAIVAERKRRALRRPPELEPGESGQVPSPETTAAWLHEIRTFLASEIHPPRNLGELNEYRAKGGLPPTVAKDQRPSGTRRSGSRLRACVAPACGKLTSRQDGLCLMHRPDVERRQLPLPGAQP